MLTDRDQLDNMINLQLQQNESAIAEKMIYLRTIRLDFLDVGPQIQNLEIFEHLENLYL
jgi:hypothetical protein